MRRVRSPPRPSRASAVRHAWHWRGQPLPECARLLPRSSWGQRQARGHKTRQCRAWRRKCSKPSEYRSWNASLQTTSPAPPKSGRSPRRANGQARRGLPDWQTPDSRNRPSNRWAVTPAAAAPKPQIHPLLPDFASHGRKSSHLSLTYSTSVPNIQRQQGHRPIDDAAPVIPVWVDHDCSAPLRPHLGLRPGP